MASVRWTDLATWRGPTPNHGGAMKEQRGVVLHIAEGTFEGTISWQKNPAAQVSSHFVVDTNGDIAQVVETDVTAWTQIEGNGHWLSVENAGHTPHALTAAQVEANAQLLARAHREFGVPLVVAHSPSDRGLGHHSMGAENGVNWGHSDCPGPNIIAQKPAIVARAIEIIEGADMALTADDIQKITDSVVHALVTGHTLPSVNPTYSAGTAWINASETEQLVKDLAAKVDTLPGGPADQTAIRAIVREELATALNATRLAVTPAAS
jgi:hypothetical protein